MARRLFIGLIGVLLFAAATGVAGEPAGGATGVAGDRPVAAMLDSELEVLVAKRDHDGSSYQTRSAIERVLADWDASGANKTPLYWLEKGRLAPLADQKERCWREGAKLPGGTACAVELADLLQRGERWQELEDFCTAAIDRHGPAAALLVARHEARLSLRNWRGAEADILAASDAEPTSERVKKALPRWERFARVIGRLEELGRTSETGGEAAIRALVERATILWSLGFPGLAAEDVRAAREASGESLALRMMEAQLVLAKNRDKGAAAEILPKLKMSAPSILDRPADLERLVVLEKRIAEGGDGAAAARLARAALFRMLDQPALALEDAEAALASGVSGKARAAATAEKAAAVAALGDSLGGYRLYREAFEAGLDDLSLLWAAVFHAKSRGEYAEAIRFAERGAKRDSGLKKEIAEMKMVLEGRVLP